VPEPVPPNHAGSPSTIVGVATLAQRSRASRSRQYRRIPACGGTRENRRFSCNSRPSGFCATARICRPVRSNANPGRCGPHPGRSTRCKRQIHL
jgi:hypothetical protein